jgi:lysophospholipase L1-like esterase
MSILYLLVSGDALLVGLGVMAAEYGVGLIPRRVLAGAIALPGHAVDGLHLSNQGHRWLARMTAAWL